MANQHSIIRSMPTSIAPDLHRAHTAQEPAAPAPFVHRGPSMAPTLMDGDLCAVDHAATWFVGDGLYLINYHGQDGGAQQVKRIIKPNPFSDRLIVVSDSADYDRFDFDHSSMSIAGRVTQSFRTAMH